MCARSTSVCVAFLSFSLIFFFLNDAIVIALAKYNHAKNVCLFEYVNKIVTIYFNARTNWWANNRIFSNNKKQMWSKNYHKFIWSTDLLIYSVINVDGDGWAQCVCRVPTVCNVIAVIWSLVFNELIMENRRQKSECVKVTNIFDLFLLCLDAFIVFYSVRTDKRWSFV